jgi:hypothetical protein
MVMVTINDSVMRKVINTSRYELKDLDDYKNDVLIVNYFLFQICPCRILTNWSRQNMDGMWGLINNLIQNGNLFHDHEQDK